jgi:predicted TIM-barrel fold metal-dependent hydrolase
MIIDAHTHIHPNPQGFGPHKDAAVNALVNNLKAAGIHKAVVLAIEPDMGNDYVAEKCAEHTELIGFVSLNPLDKACFAKNLRHYVGTGKLRGVKMHPRRQGFTIEHLKQVVELVEQAAEYRVPILFDAFPYGETYYKIQEVRLIHEVAQAVPQAHIIMAHAGGIHVMDALMVVKGNRNVVVDVSFTPFWFAGSTVYSDLVFVLRKLGADRILHGSDSPEVPVAKAVEDTLALCDQCGFNESDRELILSGNIKRLLSLNTQ